MQQFSSLLKKDLSLSLSPSKLYAKLMENLKLSFF